MDNRLVPDWQEQKAFVAQSLLALVEANKASWHVGSSGRLEFRLVTGEIYQIGQQSLIRIA
jgi:hypothetical protein